MSQVPQEPDIIINSVKFFVPATVDFTIVKEGFRNDNKRVNVGLDLTRQELVVNEPITEPVEALLKLRLFEYIRQSTALPANQFEANSDVYDNVERVDSLNIMPEVQINV